MAVKCTSCGKRIPRRMIPRMRKVTGGKTLCRRCVLDKVESGEIRKLECRDCNKDIEPRVMKRILRARKWGRIIPLLCKSCFVKRRRGRRRRRRQPPLPPSDAPPVTYAAVETGDSMHTDESEDGHIPESILHVGEWECLNCGAALEPDEVNAIRQNKVIECEYCGSSITRDQYG